MVILETIALGALAKAIIPTVTIGSWWTAYKISKLMGEYAYEGAVGARIEQFETQPHTLRQEVEQARVEDNLPAAGPDDKNLHPQYMRKRAGRRDKMVDALAAQAYFQFGHRPTSEANMIVTRKFMRDELEQYKDLRSTDALGIIDSALYLSFLPSTYLRLANQMVRTRAYHERNRDVPGTWWQRWNPWSSDHEVPVARA